MEPAKILIKIKIAEILFNCQCVKHYTKLLKNLQVDIFCSKLRYTENILLYFIL
jgi:hypothetical protein